MKRVAVLVNYLDNCGTLLPILVVETASRQCTDSKMVNEMKNQLINTTYRSNLR